MKCMLNQIFDLKEDKINVTKVCDELGISRTQFYNIWNGKKVPSVVLAIRLIDYLNQHVVSVFGEDAAAYYSVEDIWVDYTD